ncbi:MAG TPA: helix-turn-helix transcriptional regulator, partial [Draconibacterium sp.]|nr:helix-turn-helix transcriptional regulator [Draconibacterium sp.]
TNMSIIDFINTYKLKKGIELIKKKDQSISKIAYQVGFNDPKYFSRLFKKFYGMNPSDLVSTNKHADN